MSSCDPSVLTWEDYLMKTMPISSSLQSECSYCRSRWIDIVVENVKALENKLKTICVYGHNTFVRMFCLKEVSWISITGGTSLLHLRFVRTYMLLIKIHISQAVVFFVLLVHLSITATVLLRLDKAHLTQKQVNAYR